MVIIMKSSLKSDLKNTLIKNDKICFTKYSKVYLFTTENIKGYYSKLDFENKKIMIGLTELTGNNKEKASSYTGNTAIEFYKCDYSYVYLEELYKKLDKNFTVFSMLGVNRFNISVRENRVKVHIKNDRMYGAIYAVSKMDSSGGAIIFTSNAITADGRSG